MDPASHVLASDHYRAGYSQLFFLVLLADSVRVDLPSDLGTRRLTPCLDIDLLLTYHAVVSSTRTAITNGGSTRSTAVIYQR